MKGENVNKPMRVRVTGMLVALSVQYIAGMVFNLFGGDNPATRPLFAVIALYTHMVIAFFILVGAIFILVFAYKSGSSQVRLGSRWIDFAYRGFFSILISIAAGIATLLLKGMISEVASFIMALSFLYAFVTYGYLFMLFRGDDAKIARAK